ncbi:MAG: FAD-dependent oxidoreductase [Bryobacteraceae bacterium]
MRPLLVLAAAFALNAQTFTVVDVQNVPALGDYRSALKTFTLPAVVPEERCDVLVAGAGMGGVSAALTIARYRLSVCVTEETDWLGGQMTAGGVSAMDENRFIEFAGGTRSYYGLRERIRRHYREKTALKPEFAAFRALNPGACYVSALCFEPPVGVAVVESMLREHSGIRVFPRTAIAHLEIAGGKIRSALAYQFDTKRVLRFRPGFVLDATEMGDLLPLAKVPYVTGSEPRSETGEPHAAEKANQACVQSFTYPFVIEHRPGQDHRIPKPPEYERIRDSQPFSFRVTYPVEYGWRGPFTYAMFGEDAPIPNNMSPRPFFSWRRILAARQFTSGVPNDVALINWPRQDYHSESVLDREPADVARILQAAKRVSLAFLYWLQNDVPRDDGNVSGYPDLTLRPELMGSPDGLSKYPYIRESRRIRAKGRVVEQDIVADYQPGPRAKFFPDSVGSGFYMVDIHPCGANERGRMMMPKPFQIPMSTLIPVGVANFLPAGKNLGVTHLTNGAFRLHPVEWNIGEAAAVLAVLTLKAGGTLPTHERVQEELARAGVPLYWFDDLFPSHPAFAAIQVAALRGWYPIDPTGLHASPEAPLTRAEAAKALAAFFGEKTDDAGKLAVSRGWMAVDHRNWFHPDLPFVWTDCRAKLPPSATPVQPGPVTRAEWALRLTR